MRIVLFIILLVILAGAGLVFAIKNPGDVPLDLYLHQTEMPIAALVFIVFIAGFLIGWLFRTLSVLKASSRARRAERKLSMIEREVAELRPATAAEEVI